MDNFFKPENVAILGVSEKSTNMAKNIVANLQEFKFNGIIYAVGRNGGKLYGRRIYKSVQDIPDKVDLAVILTPADTVPELLEECGLKGVGSVIIESAGFGEFGEEGKAREKKVVEIAKKYNIKFMGPNCIGTMDMHSGLILPFLVFKDDFTKGNVSIVSQSGGVAFTLLNLLTSESIGIAKIASIGNKLNIDENDMIEYLLKDKETGVIIVYLEGISDGKRLMDILAKAKKPVLMHKANVGMLGKAIAASHTAALSSDDAVVDAAFRQVGVARFRDRATLVNYLKILPLPRIKGNNLAIISRSGGHAILAADAAELTGFTLAPFKKEFIKEIESHLRANVIKLTNPLDLGDLFDYDMYVKIIERTVKEKDVDGVVFLHTYFSATEGEASRRLIEATNELSHKYGKPIGVCVATDEEEVYKLRKNLKQPVFTAPIEIIRAFALSRDFNFEVKKVAKITYPSGKNEVVQKIISKCKKEKRSPLLNEGLEIFKAFNIPIAQSAFAKTATDTAIESEKIGYPVALKLVSASVSHKTDFGGVKLGLQDAKAVKAGCSEMQKKIKAKIDGFVIQKMVKDGFELILGAKKDPNFGNVVVVGLGGIFVEVLKDVAMRIVPFPKEEAYKMLEELKGYAILKGLRGKPPLDIDAVVDSIMKLAALVDQNEEIEEVDINPFYVMPKGKGGVALDARIII